MSSNSSNTAVAHQPPASSPSSVSAKTAAAAPTSPSTPSRTPYGPAQQLELLNLHAELDALLYQLNAANAKALSPR